MSNYKFNLGPIDYNSGVHLSCLRTEFGDFRYWMVIDGREIDLSANQYETMMRMFHETRQDEQDRIIRLFSKNYARFDASNNMVDGMSEQEFIELVRKRP